MTMQRPIIAVPADIRTFENYTWHATPDTYLKAALRVAGVIPLIVPALSEGFDLADILDRVDGVMTTGSATNVHPGRYGVGATASYEPFDTNRDTLSCAMIQGRCPVTCRFLPSAVATRSSTSRLAAAWRRRYRICRAEWIIVRRPTLTRPHVLRRATPWPSNRPGACTR